MIRRKLVIVFPFFFSYAAVIVCTSSVLIFVRYGHRGYSLMYWLSEILAISLGFMVIFEILRHILSPVVSLSFLLNAVAVLAAFSAVIAVMILVSAKPDPAIDWLLKDIVLAERYLRLFQASLLIVVIAFMSVLGLTWRHESLGILTGFGVYSVVALVVYEFGYQLHWMSTTAYVRLNSAGYDAAVLIWAFYILPRRRRMPPDSLPNADLEEWNNTFDNYLKRSRR